MSIVVTFTTASSYCAPAIVENAAFIVHARTFTPAAAEIVLLAMEYLDFLPKIAIEEIINQWLEEP